eukprot:TRINITY_DN1041_c0_g1_i11.p1 TRINITY_DN1041_c0_g1~~TRINITY_DN1041_c0_g1_i11.p1  ORF type:complete len:1910 (+),score=93.60 TRINITY_DN1041_c0_g1_i11:51-5780(+)
MDAMRQYVAIALLVGAKEAVGTCPVPTSADLVGAYANPGGGGSPDCYEGSEVRQGLDCEWTRRQGYDCQGVTVSTCQAGGAWMPVMDATTCSLIECTQIMKPAGLIPIVAGELGELAPCAETGVNFDAMAWYPLGPSVLLNRCGVKCDTAAGYAEAYGSLSCPDVTPTMMTPLQVNLVCVKITCDVASFTASPNFVNPVTGGGCSEVGSGDCALTCIPGSTTASGMAPLLRCVTTGDNSGELQIINPCLPPAFCGSYDCPAGFNRMMVSQPCPQVTVVANNAECVAGDADNNNDCCVVAACPANSGPPGTCNCNAGYQATSVLEWMDGSGWGHTCEPITCPVLQFSSISPGLIGSGVSACADGQVLDAVVNPACTLTCDPRFYPTAPASDPLTVACDPSTGNFQIGTDPYVIPFTCEEKMCQPFSLPEGAEAGLSNGCGEGEVLSPFSNPSCTVKCKDGYDGTSTVITCPSTANHMDVPTGGILCTRSRCGVYIYPTGVHGYGDTVRSIEPCSNNTGLELGDVCTIGCRPGFSPPDPLPQDYRAEISCPLDSRSGAQVVGGLSCTPNCAGYTCPMGWQARANPASITCTTGECEAHTCCNLKACPTNAADVWIGATFVQCACNPGYTGEPDWDVGAQDWSHSCTPTCANPNFVGCPSGKRALVPREQMPCTGVGVCDGTGCPACQENDCCEEIRCRPVGTVAGYNFAGGADCATVTECDSVTCARGYVGTPTLRCPAEGVDFDVCGCVPVACPENSGPPGVCECSTGYGIRAGGMPVWNVAGGTWTHRCDIVCTHHLFSGCDGKAVKVGANNIYCTAAATGNPMMDCTEDVCCSALCSASNICNGVGLLRYPDAAMRVCTGNDPNSCTEALCCESTCDHPQFNGCQQPGFQLINDASRTYCPTNDPATCSVDVCCDPTDCLNFECPAGRSWNGATQDCGGVCSDTICCRDNVCSAPGTNFPEFLIPGAPLCTTSVACGGVQCSTGYSAAPGEVPRMSCPFDNGNFQLSGCVENVCEPAVNVPGYMVSNAPGCTSVSTCGSVSCALGFAADAGLAPRVICPISGGVMSGAGCMENSCQPPDIDAWRVAYPGYLLSTTECTTASECGAVTCAPGYGGKATLQCPVEGGRFTVIGCQLNHCVQPLDKFPGYNIPTPQCSVATACGQVSCAPGAMGVASIACPEEGGDFELTGCVPYPCPENAAGPGCVCNDGYKGDPNFVPTPGGTGVGDWTHSCEEVKCPPNSGPIGKCECSIGYKGVSTWSTSRQMWLHACTPVPCPPNSVDNADCDCLPGFAGIPAFDAAIGWTHSCVEGSCTPPLGLVGYNIQFGSTCTSVDACGTVTCAPGFAGTNPSVVCGANGVFQGVGCNGAQCPPGSGPPGVCNCQDGYIGGPPRWTGGGWAHTCQGVACPANTDNVQGSCRCANGFTGTPRWTGSQWTHTCSVAQCPPDAGPPGVCNCQNGAAVTPTFVIGTGWTHRCTNGCPLGSVDTDTRCAALRANCADPAILARCPCTCTTNIPPCGGTCAFAGGVSAVSAAVGQSYSSMLITNMGPGEAGQIVQVSCTADNPSLFSTQPVVSPVGGVLTFTASAVGSTNVNCIATDNGVPVQSTPFSFLVNAGGAGPSPVPVGSVDSWISLRLRKPITLSRKALSDDLRALLGVPGIVIHYVCPTSACGGRINGCPSSHDQRMALGCRTGQQMSEANVEAALRRGFEGLQQEDVIVDFDIQTSNPDGSAAKNQERFTAVQRLNADIAQCQTTGTCVLRNQNPIQTSVLTPRVLDAGDDNDDDGGLAWWAWLLIVLGALAFLSCLIFLCVLCCKDKKEEREEVVVTEKTEPGKSYESGYSDSYYASSYEPSTAAMEFFAGDRVMAQYIDGTYYEGTIEERAMDGTYKIHWQQDGSVSEGVPANQIRPM